MEEDEIRKLVNKIVEERLKEGLGQFDIAPQTIKERHLDWEEFNSDDSSLNSSFIKTVSLLVKNSGGYEGSSTLADGEDYSVSLQISFPSYDRKFLGVWHHNWYETSATLANAIPFGTSITPSDYRWYGSPTEYGLTTLYTVSGVAYYGRSKADFWLENNSGGNKDVIIKTKVRYLGITV